MYFCYSKTQLPLATTKNSGIYRILKQETAQLHYKLWAESFHIFFSSLFVSVYSPDLQKQSILCQNIQQTRTQKNHHINTTYNCVDLVCISFIHSFLFQAGKAKATHWKTLCGYDHSFCHTILVFLGLGKEEHSTQGSHSTQHPRQATTELYDLMMFSALLLISFPTSPKKQLRLFTCCWALTFFFSPETDISVTT